MNNPIRRTFLIALLLAGTVFSSACHRSQTPAAKRYPFTGRVVSLDNQSHQAFISGDDIPGFMDAMAMSYKIKPEDTLTHLLPGDAISAEVVTIPADPKNEDAVPDYWLENVKVTGHVEHHTGQIILLTKQLTATDLDLSMPRKR